MAGIDSAALRRSPLTHKLVVAGLGLAVICLIAFENAYRVVEIRLAAAIISLVGTGGTRVDGAGPTVYFGIGTDKSLGLRMTPECTSAFLIIPLFVVAGIMIALRPRITRRALVALGIASVILILVNQARLLALVGLVNGLGTARGYYWGHTMGGSMISVFGGAIALVVFVWLATKKTPEERERIAAAKAERYGGAARYRRGDHR